MIDTNSTLYRMLVWGAVASVVFVVGSVVFQYLFVEEVPGELNYRTGNLRLEDGLYRDALTEFDAQLQQIPNNPAGLLGRGLALMGMGELQAAREALDAAILVEPGFAAAYANRGILNDRMGRHREALEDYRRALRLDEEMGEGPGWITRFFRKQAEAPPTIVDRARYLESELKKAPSERLLLLPEVDQQQRSYKHEGKL